MKQIPTAAIRSTATTAGLGELPSRNDGQLCAADLPQSVPRRSGCARESIGNKENPVDFACFAWISRRHSDTSAASPQNPIVSYWSIELLRFCVVNRAAFSPYYQSV
ncbi:hypothetical protein Y032_0015g2817 [Ancylostoma ceylanicum]|uniref:Uncharacterized protein n=1 Tax=Ancylostoma ceylanicum TaxID=53326 RepID=A0A016V7W8_9BILA|nr:hypothetical protein Y032_0015g2817 [Ancylostoma ceylanicum]